jgi:hypothetical protein
MRGYISLGASSVVLAGAFALGCNASAGNDEGGTSAGTASTGTADESPPYFKAYTAEASSATQGATGVVSWSVGMYSRGMIVVGRDTAGKTLVEWKASRTGGETRYNLRAAADAATMTIGHDGDQPVMRENTFYQNQELQRVLTALNSDLNAHGDGASTAQASRSSKGGLSTRGVPLLPNGPCQLLFDQTCSNEISQSGAADTEKNFRCIGCPTGGFGKAFNDTFGICEDCKNAMLAQAVAQQNVNRCANNTKNKCGALSGPGFNNSDYDRCLNSGLPISMDECCTDSGGTVKNGICGT